MLIAHAKSFCFHSTINNSVQNSLSRYKRASASSSHIHELVPCAVNYIFDCFDLHEVQTQNDYIDHSVDLQNILTNI